MIWSTLRASARGKPAAGDRRRRSCRSAGEARGRAPAGRSPAADHPAADQQHGRRHQTLRHQRPIARRRPRQRDRGGEARVGRPRSRSAAMAPKRICRRSNAQCCTVSPLMHEAERQPARHRRQFGLAVEAGEHGRPERQERGQRRAGGGIDPEQRRDLRVAEIRLSGWSRTERPRSFSEVEDQARSPPPWPAGRRPRAAAAAPARRASPVCPSTRTACAPAARAPPRRERLPEVGVEMVGRELAPQATARRCLADATLSTYQR